MLQVVHTFQHHTNIVRAEQLAKVLFIMFEWMCTFCKRAKLGTAKRLSSAVPEQLHEQLCEQAAKQV